MKIGIIGGGISGLISAINIKKQQPNYDVFIVEKNECCGGRLYQTVVDNYILNNGPSWYWMNDIIQDVYQKLNIDCNYDLMKPNYQYQFMYNGQTIKIPNDKNEIRNLILSFDPECGNKYDAFIEHTKEKYDICKKEFLQYNNISFTEYVSFKTLSHLFKLDLFKSYRQVINDISDNEIVRKILEWPALFIGENPETICGLFTILTYSMLVDGTSIPCKNGMIEIIQTLEKKAIELGVKIYTNSTVYKYGFSADDKIQYVSFLDKDGGKYNLNVDYVINSSDYYYNELLLPNKYMSYPQTYWNNLSICPQSTLFNLVLNKKIPSLMYHNLFFDNDYKSAFYVNKTSAYFDEVPTGCENLFILSPNSFSEKSYEIIIERLTNFLDIDIKKHIIYKHIDKPDDFKMRFNAFKGNSYGLGMDNYQFGFFRPCIKSRYLSNLYNCGQLTNPGPGIPPCMISGLIASNLVLKSIELSNANNHYANNHYANNHFTLNNIRDLKDYKIFLTMLFVILVDFIKKIGIFIKNIGVFNTNMIVMIKTCGFNYEWFKKEFNFVFFGKIYTYSNYNE